MSDTEEVKSNPTYCNLSKELEALKAVYLDDFCEDPVCEESKEESNGLEKSTKYSINLFPSTADNTKEQYVKLTLVFTVPEKYPELVPSVEIKNARGLSEEKVKKLQETLEKMAKEKKGSNMLYDLSNYVKESLTLDNFPTGQCMVCLYEFTRDDIYVVTKCFHHFHSRCLANYIEKGKDCLNTEQKESDIEHNLMPCPVCRDNSDLSHLVSEPANSYPPPTLSQRPLTEEKSLLEEAKQQQEKFVSIYEKQQEKGGIIDVEAENNRFFIKISNTDKRSNNNGEISTNSSSSEYHSSDETKPEEDKESKKTASKEEEFNNDNTGTSTEEKNVSNSSSLETSQNSTQNKDDSTSKTRDSQEEKVKSGEDKEEKENKPSTSRRSRSRRGKNRRRARSRQSQMLMSKEEESIQNVERRSRPGRLRNGSNYSRSYQNPSLRNNSGRGRNRSRNSAGGLASPPYRRNFGSFSHNEKNFQEENSRDHDRPGYYVARGFPSSSAPKNEDSKINGTAKMTGSELTEQNVNKQTNLDNNRKQKKRNGNQNRRRNKRYNENDYQNVIIYPMNNYQHLNSMQIGRKHRQTNYPQNYRFYDHYANRNYPYYNNNRNVYSHYQNYNSVYASNYTTGYGYDFYYNYNYGRNNYNNSRVNYRPRNYHNTGYRQRKNDDNLPIHLTSKNENQARNKHEIINDRPELNN